MTKFEEHLLKRLVAIKDKVKAVPDVSEFITKTVDDLVYYYTKSQVYTKDEIAELIAAIEHFHYEVAASTSAVTEPQTNVLYLIGPTGSGADKYEEYVYPNSTTGWVKIGDTTLDLSGYVTIQALNTTLANYQALLVSGTNIKTINNESILGPGNIDIQASIVANESFPAGWPKTGKIYDEDNHSSDLIYAINHDNNAIAGKIYLATVSFSDLPANLMQAEIKVEVLNVYRTNEKMILLTVTSSDTVPYHWEYSSVYDEAGVWRSWDIAGAAAAAAAPKANKSEMTVTNGEGADADKVNIQLKNGTVATVLKTHQDISGKADKSELSGKQDVIPDLNTIRSKANGAVQVTIETTWAALKALRDAGTLVPGQLYRITDYVSTTASAGTHSANHPFDVIVLALDSNKLAEEAWAALHSGDTYFVNNDLSAWQIWYCLDNDTSRFAWADAVNGKGVIYRMIDEFNNDVPYDFKNIVYEVRPEITVGFPYGPGVTTTLSRDTSHDVGGLYAYKTAKQQYGSPEYVYFSDDPVTIDSVPKNSSGNTIYCTIESISSDNYDTFTFDVNSVDASLSVSQKCYGNKIRSYTVNGVAQLNKNIFRTSENILCCNSNFFDYNCYLNKFGKNSYNNYFGVECFENSFISSNQNNSFGNRCNNNSFGNGCYRNSIGNGFRNNSFGDDLYSNYFGNSCSNNSLGNYCYGNSFGNACTNNAIGNDCSYNAFGNNCSYNAFGTSLSELKSYYRYIIFEEGNSHINLNCTATTSGNSYYQNVKISQGVNNSNTAKTITDSNVNQTYQTIYANDGSGNIVAVNVADIAGVGTLLSAI